MSSSNQGYTVRARETDGLVRVEQMSGGMVVRQIPLSYAEAISLRKALEAIEAGTVGRMP